MNDQVSPAMGIGLADGTWHWVSVSWRGPDGRLRLYLDDALVYKGELAPGARIAAGGTLSFGVDADGAAPFIGFMEALQLWSEVLEADELQANRHLPLTGREPGLLGYWPLEDLGSDQIRDRSPNGWHGARIGQVRIAPSTAPIGFLGDGTVDSTEAILVANEYPTQEVNALGQSEGLMRRFYAFFQPDAIGLLQDRRIDMLEVRWVGNAQFDPTLMGYIEGAPPVPSEDLTAEESYDGAASVALTATEDVSYSWTRSQEAGLGIEVDAVLGSAAEVAAGFIVMTSVEAGFGFTGNLSSSYSLLDEGTVSLDIGNAFQDRLSLRGARESSARFPRVGQRYAPKNVGYALVV